MITVVSAAYGGYDQPIAPPDQDIDVRWVMVTDGQVDVPAPWEHVIEPRPELHPRLAAKHPKCLPWLYADTDTDIVVWLDASALVHKPDFASTCLAALGDGDVAQWVHPERGCIHPEADVSAQMLKYQNLPVHAQVDHYAHGGHPENFGLWATGCMVHSCHANDRAAGQMWLEEQCRWTYQDQLSWPVAVRQFNLDVRPMPGSLWDHQTLTFRSHRSDL